MATATTNLNLTKPEATDTSLIREDINSNSDIIDGRFSATYMAIQAKNAVTITGGSITGITDLAIADGGTGSSTAANARTALGLAIGTNVQAYDATLLSIAALGTAADKIAYTTNVDTWAETALTAFARSILDDANEATFKATVNLEIGVDVEAYDAGLLSIAALTTAADKMIYTTALDTYAVTSLTAFARTILDDANASTVRTTLGLVISTNVAEAGANDDITALTGLTTALGLAYGGTGQSTAQLAINALTAVAGATNEYVLTKDTTTGNAIFKVAAGGGASTFIALTDTPANYTGSALKFARVNAGETALEFAAGAGGGYTNLTSFVDQTAWRLFYSNTSGDVVELALGANQTYLRSNGASAAPTFKLIYIETGATNSAVGKDSLPSASGVNNTAMGLYTLYYDTTGHDNTAIGVGALQTNVSGSYNSAVGVSSLILNTGSNNTAMGYESLRSNSSGYENTAMGMDALYSNTTGIDNTAMGVTALNSNTTGSNNIAMGKDAGNFQANGSTALTTPENSLYLGYGARGKDNDDNNSIVIGYNAIGQGADTVVLGNSSITKTYLQGTIQNKLSAFLATTSAELAGVISDKTGTDKLVYNTSPTLVTPILGTPTSGTLTNCTFPTLNQNTTGSAGTCTGNAGSATYASATTITDDTTTVATMYPLWVTANTGNLPTKVSSSKLSFVPSTGILSATGFAGPLTGNVTGNASGSSGTCTGLAGSATILATTRAIYGNNFDGSAALTGIIASTYGGTGNGFTKFTGPATAERTFTLPNENATLARTDAAQSFTGIQTMTSPALTTPAITGISTGTGVATAASVNTLALRDASGNISTVNLLEGYTTTATAAGTTTLVVGSTYLQYFTGTTTQIVKMPVTSTLVLGQQYLIVNNSTGLVTVNSSGDNAIIILNGNTSVLLTCILITGTTAASWSASYQGIAITTGKKLSVSNTLTLAGTDATTMTFPTTSATIARIDAANTFTGIQTMTSPAITTSITTASTSFTAWAGATTLLTIGGTGASASLFAPSTLDTTSSTTGAIRTSGGISAAKAGNIGTILKVGTGIAPNANDGAYLGTTALQFSDLFLAEGGVINWDNGDVTLTQTGNTLNLAGGEFSFGANTAGFTQQTVTYNVTTTTVDWTLGNKATVTLTGNVGTLAFTNPTNPCNVLLKIVQDATGSRLITAYDADVKWAGGTKPTLTTTANGIDICSFYWDGTNYFGNSSLAFAVPA